MRCKPNQRAIITHGPNSGALVETVKFLGTHENMKAVDLWIVTPLQHVKGCTTGRRCKPGEQGLIRDAHLCPLPDDPDELDVPPVKQPITEPA
jgi:hypothetical protein